MDTLEIHGLASWFLKINANNKLLDSLNKQVNDLANANDVYASTARVDVEAHISALFIDAAKSDFSKHQLKILRDLDITILVTNSCVNILNSIFHKSLSRHEVVANLRILSSSLVNANKAFATFTNSMNLMQLDLDNEMVSNASRLEAGESKMRIIFTEEASISNFADMKAWGANWYQISRGAGFLLSDDKFSDYRIVSAGNGSLFVDFISNLESINVILDFINSTWDIALKSAGAYVLYEKAKARFDSSTDEEKERLEPAVQVFKEDADDNCRKFLEEEAKRLIKQYDSDVGYTSEVAKSLRLVSEYLRRGGKVELLEEAIDETDLDALNSYADKVRRLDETLRQIESKDFELPKLTNFNDSDTSGKDVE